MDDLRRKLDDEAARRGVAFVLDSGGVILEPSKCPECIRWGARPEHCEHVDQNVGVMVRCVLGFDSDEPELFIGPCHAQLGIAEEGLGDTMPEALARILLKLWEGE